MMQSILFGLVDLFQSVLNIYIWIIIIGALLSWVKPDPYNPIVQLIYRLTDPAYAFIRKRIPTVFNGVDLAPMILLLGLQVIDIVIVSLLKSWVGA